MLSDTKSTQCVYNETGRHKQPLVPLLPFLYNALGACLIATRPSPLIKAGAIVILVCALLYTTTTYTSKDPMLDYMVCTVSAIFMANIIPAAYDPDAIQSVRYEENDHQPLMEKPLLARLWLTLLILMNPRLVGTNAQHVSTPPPFKGTRKQFLAMRLLQFVTSAVMFVLLVPLAGMHSRFPESLVLPATTAAWIVGGALSLTMLHAAASFIAVAAHMSSPEAWPDLFGPYAEAYTVSRGWGRVWHQLVHSSCTRWSDAVHRALGIPRSTLVSRLVLVNVAFAVSGLVHSVGDLSYGGRACFGRSWPFFALNGLAVSLESVLAPYARRAGISGRSRAWRLLGYVWVWAWFAYSLPPFQRWTLEIQIAGKPQHSRVKDALLLFVQRFVPA